MPTTPMRLTLTLLAALVLPAALPAQRDRDDRDDRRRDRAERESTSRIDTTFAFEPRGQVELSSLAGEMTVRGWDRDEARVVATSDGVELRLDASRSRISLREDGGRRGHSDETVYQVTVPYGTRVVMRNTSGDIVARDVRGEVEARSTSGNVTVEGTNGRTIAESISGEIEARRVNGPLRGQSTSGSVKAEDVTGDVELETVSGDVVAKQARASSVRLSTTSGEIEFSGPIDRSGRYEFNAHSGNITLSLPSDASAQVSVQTFSGELDTDFPLTLTPGSGRNPRHFEFTLGGGGARLTAESFSGNINLRRSGSRRD